MIKSYTIILLLFISVFTHQNVEAKIREEKLQYNTIHFDKEDVLWIGASTGLYQWRQYYSYKINLPELLDIVSIASYNNYLFLATKDKKIYQFDKFSRRLNFVFTSTRSIKSLKIINENEARLEVYGGSAQVFLFKNLQLWQIKSIAPIQFKSLAIDKYKYTLDSLGTIRKTYLNDTASLPFQSCPIGTPKINDFTMVNHYLVAATNQGSFVIDTLGNWVIAYDKSKSFKQVEHDKQGAIWLCGKQALASHFGATFIPQPEVISNPDTLRYSLTNIEDSLTKYFGKISAYLKDSAGKSWIAHPNQGIRILDFNQLYHLTKHEGLLSNTIISMRETKHEIVALSSNGLDIIDKANFEITHLSSNSFLTNEIPISLISSISDSSSIFIRTNKRDLAINIDAIEKLRNPSIFIQSIEVMDKPVQANFETFDYDENYFKFQYHIPDNFNEIVFLRYKLKGLSDRWLNTNEMQVIFPRLNSGTYTFQIQVANNKNFEHYNEDSYRFTIAKPFWKKTWFGLFLFCLIAFAIYQYVKYRELKSSQEQAYAKEKAIAEFENLKQQVSPHFLFNSFNTLIQLIEEDKDKAVTFTTQLSDFYRSLISYRDINLITLEEDYKLLKNYIDLQKTRFGDNLNLICHITPEEKVGLSIPPLTLQLLAENAIKHNVISKNKPLVIKLFFKENKICILNNSNPKDNPEPGERIGLQNIKSRFKQYSSTEVSITTENGNFEINLPIIKTETS